MRKRFNGWQRTATALALAAGLAAVPGEGKMAEAKPTPPAETFGIDKASQPEAGLIAAGQPTAEQLKKAAKAGYKTVLDLRPPAEERGFDEAKAAKEAGLEYVNLPVTASTAPAPTGWARSTMRTWSRKRGCRRRRRSPRPGRPA
ncbi:MAG TPA: sulfur transferase domain-containing protein [Thermoanaerobaculia bacterium]|nr:sulfur transferase domain-containing protein [Thermoanaerobaculia bacterium]